MSLSEKLKGVKNKARNKGPVWRGPEEDGVTFSLLSRFLTCRERFRALVVDGLKPVDQFNHRVEYGNMWHVCEEALAANRDVVASVLPVWLPPLTEYAKALCRRYPLAQEQVDKWYNACQVQFPVYVRYWSEHPDVVDRTPLLQERVFDVPYKLPSGRTVRLRGKWDSVDLVGKGKQAGVYLQENKTKGDVDEVQMQRQLTFDLQTMMYMVALREAQTTMSLSEDRDVDDLLESNPLRGVRYNVVRRPLSGGRGTIVQHKPSKSKPLGESSEDYYARLQGIIDGSTEDAPGPSYFFMRWKTEITPGDVDRFRQRCLDPILEQLCAWWSWCRVGDPFRPKNDGLIYHWQHPFGVRNMLDEGGSTDLDEYLLSGSEVGLQRTDNLFPEL